MKSVSSKGAVVQAAASSKQDELLEAARAGDLESVSTLLTLGVKCNSPNSVGQTPLIVACEMGHTGVVRLLLEAGADPNLVASNGSFALRAGVMSGEAECIELLLDKSADVNLATHRGTALIAAASQGDCDTLGMLLDRGADVQQESADGVTALMAAVREDRRQAVQVLLRRGANPDKPSSLTGITALKIAEDKNLPEVYSLLLQSSLTSAADDAIAESDKRQQASMAELEVHMQDERRKLQELAAASKVQVSKKIHELQAEKEELMRRLGLKK